MAERITIPDLTKTDSRKGVVLDDFGIEGAFSRFSSKQDRKFISSLFLDYYNIENAVYRRDFVSEWLDNNSTRKELEKMLRALPGTRPEYVSLPSDWDSNPDEYVRRQIRVVRKYLLLPETLELIASYSGSSPAAKDLISFAGQARRGLEEYAQFVKPIKDCPQFKDKLSVDFMWANDCMDKIQPYLNLLDSIRKVRRKLAYYRYLSVPYEFTINGERIPSCKPEYLDPELRQGCIKNAYHPSYFKFDSIRKGERWKKVVASLNVPNDISWDENSMHTYVYGPNDMGKSVYISTVALNVHLAMNGARCFADSCKLSLPGRIFPCFDMGDAVGSGHFVTGARKLNYMLGNVMKDDMVFLDEHAGGAEPDAEREIAKGILKALTSHKILFYYATNDRDSWNHSLGNERAQHLQVADYQHMELRGKVWPGIANAGYSMEKARQLQIDPESAERRLDERLS